MIVYGAPKQTFYDTRVTPVVLSLVLQHAGAEVARHADVQQLVALLAIETESFPDRDGAAMREADLIFELDPPLNKVGRRTREGEAFVAGAHGPVESCPHCTAMGLLRCGDDLVDAQYVGKDGTAFGNAAWFHRCPARRLG